MNRDDTITAPATPNGEGGIAIVRVSGPLAESLMRQYFRSSSRDSEFRSHFFYHGLFLNEEQEPLDEVMAVLMRQPRSYTRDDVLEIHCHGGYLSMQRILETFLRGGARLAEPGEFTLRAFLNGRIDLAEAEAVIDIIQARSDRAARNALRHLRGDLSTLLRDIRSKLVDLLVLLEAYVDFPDEEVAKPHSQDFKSGAEAAEIAIEKILNTFNVGKMLKDGMVVLLLGRPNVGKSSLLNLLLGENRAIVTEIPGTTRDTIEECTTLGGFPLKLIDTAGVRDSADPIEIEGVERAKGKIASADLVLLLVDGSQPLTHEDFKALGLCADSRRILVVNKEDLGEKPLPQAFLKLPTVKVSARTGSGLERLQHLIVDQFSSSKGLDTGDFIILSSLRQKESLSQSLQSLARFKSGLEQGMPFECLATDLRDAIQFLGEVTGETLSEEVLNRIFSRFCIGK